MSSLQESEEDGAAWRAVLDELKALRVQPGVRAKPSLDRLVGEVHVLTGQASERMDARVQAHRHAGDEASLAAATELLLQSGSLEALGPRATRALIMASLLQLACVTVLAMVEIVVVLVLILERDALLPLRAERSCLLAWAAALQLLAVPWLLRWIESKLVWSAYDETLADLEGALTGLEPRL